MRYQFIKTIVCCALVGMIWSASPAEVYANEAEALSTATAEEKTANPLPALFRTTANLHFRTGPSTDYDVILTVPQSTTVNVTDLRDGKWYAVEFNGISGYMFAEYLFDTSKIVETAGVNGVELLDWSEAKQIFKTGVPVQVTDVRTGITYNVSSFSNGNHADVETFTQEDTDAMFRTYNGRWSWDTRPIWVTIGDRTIAASINGMPHGGGVISGNGMNGQVCIHFFGSRIHPGASLAHERDHQNSVQEAFKAAMQNSMFGKNPFEDYD